MCIRDRRYVVTGEGNGPVNALDAALREAIGQAFPEVAKFCLLYTSDAADERSSVDLGGRRIIKNKKT